MKPVWKAPPDQPCLTIEKEKRGKARLSVWTSREAHLPVATFTVGSKHLNALVRALSRCIQIRSSKPASHKNKGRRAALLVKEALHLFAPDLRPGDIEVTSSGACGEDLKLSPAARDLYPMTFEVKCQENLNVWDALAQAESHAEGTNLAAVLAFKRNKTKVYVALELHQFLKLVR